MQGQVGAVQRLHLIGQLFHQLLIQIVLFFKVAFQQHLIVAQGFGLLTSAIIAVQGPNDRGALLLIGRSH